MCPAKVITPQGITFFVKKGEDIHNSPAYDTLPLRDKRYLACESIKGNGEGFALTSDFHEPIVVTQNRELTLPRLPGIGPKWDFQNDIPILILPEGTRIKPLTNQQMEDELRAEHRPSLREK